MFFALWFLRFKRALEAQYGPQMAQERAPRRAPERPKTCPRALKSAPSAAQEATKRRFFFEGGMQNNIFNLFGQWSQDSPKTPPRPFSRASRGPKMAQKWPKMASRWPQVRLKNIEIT